MNIGEYYYFRIRKVMNVYQTRYPEKYKALYNEIMNAPIGEYGRMDTLIYMIIVKNLMKNMFLNIAKKMREHGVSEDSIGDILEFNGPPDVYTDITKNVNRYNSLDSISMACEFEEFRGIENETKQQNVLREQAESVKGGYTKPAYKKDITPEKCYGLYKKFRNQQAVADELGVSVKTVRARLKEYEKTEGLKELFLQQKCPQRLD